MIDSLEYYYGMKDEDDKPRQQEEPQPVDKAFDEMPGGKE